MSEGGGYHKVTLSQINSYDAWNKSWIIQYDVFAQVSGAFRDSPIWEWFTRAPRFPSCEHLLRNSSLWGFLTPWWQTSRKHSPLSCWTNWVFTFMWSVLNLIGGIFQLSSKLLKMTARPQICDIISSQIMIEKKKPSFVLLYLKSATKFKHHTPKFFRMLNFIHRYTFST